MTGLADFSLGTSIQSFLPGASLCQIPMVFSQLPLISSHRSCPQQYLGTVTPSWGQLVLVGGPGFLPMFTDLAPYHQPPKPMLTLEHDSGKYLSFCVLELMLPVVQEPKVGTGSLDQLSPPGGLLVPTCMRMGLLLLRPRHLCCCCCCCSVREWAWPLHPVISLLRLWSMWPPAS